MIPQEESRIYAAIDSMDSKLDDLIPDVRAIKEHLAKLNGSVAKHSESINQHDIQIATTNTHLAKFFQDAQDIKVMKLPQVIERVEWHNKIIWAVMCTSI